MHFFVYILECADGAYYVGSHRGEDVENRVEEHNLGLNQKAYTYKRRPVTCLWSEALDNPDDMIAAERRLKGWSRAKKEAFIAGDMARLKALSVSENSPAIAEKGKFYKETGLKRSKT